MLKSKNLNIKNLLLILTLTFAQSCYSLNVIFDLGGVLINTDAASMMRKIGLYSIIMDALHCNNPLALKKRLFEALAKIPTETKNEFGAGDDKERPLPNILCDWLSGKKTSTEIKSLALDVLNGEQPLIAKIIKLMFTPKLFMDSVTISQEGLEFVKKCKESGHRIFILSNWDLESSFIVTKKFPELFDLFNENDNGKNIVFSGQVGLIKPDPRIYEYIVKTNNLDPKECIFFDDQEINVESAKKLGIHSVVCKNPKCEDLVRELNAFTKQVASKYLYPENSNIVVN